MPQGGRVKLAGQRGVLAAAAAVAHAYATGWVGQAVGGCGCRGRAPTAAVAHAYATGGVMSVGVGEGGNLRRQWRGI